MSFELVRASTDFASWNPDAVFGATTYGHEHDEYGAGEEVEWFLPAQEELGTWDEVAENPLPDFDSREQQEFVAVHPAYKNPFGEDKEQDVEQQYHDLGASVDDESIDSPMYIQSTLTHEPDLPPADEEVAEHGAQHYPPPPLVQPEIAVISEQLPVSAATPAQPHQQEAALSPTRRDDAFECTNSPEVDARLQIEAAAACIQKTVRGYLGRKRAVRKMLEKERQVRKHKRRTQQQQRAARAIQHNVREWLLRVRSRKQREHTAALIATQTTPKADEDEHDHDDDEEEEDDEDADDAVAVYTAPLSPERTTLTVRLPDGENEDHALGETEPSEPQVFSMSNVKPLAKLSNNDDSLLLAEDSLEDLPRFVLQPHPPPRARDSRPRSKPIKQVRTGGVSLIPRPTGGSAAASDSTGEVAAGSRERRVSELRKRQSTPRFDARAIIEDQAATTIQRVWRGWTVRASMPTTHPCTNCGHAQTDGQLCRRCGRDSGAAPRNQVTVEATSATGMSHAERFRSRIPRLRRTRVSSESARRPPPPPPLPPQHLLARTQTPRQQKLQHSEQQLGVEEKQLTQLPSPITREQHTTTPNGRRPQADIHTNSRTSPLTPPSQASPHPHRRQAEVGAGTDGNGGGGGGGGHTEGYLAMFEKQRQARKPKQPRRRIDFAETESLPPIPCHGTASPAPSSYSDAARRQKQLRRSENILSTRRMRSNEYQQLPAV